MLARMTDTEKPGAPPDAVDSHEGVTALWDRFRAGEVVPCPADQRPMALSVDGSVGTYRLVCTHCGLATPWFEAGPNGVRLRGSSGPMSTRSPAG
jgi:hypothetical protein